MMTMINSLHEGMARMEKRLNINDINFNNSMQSF